MANTAMQQLKFFYERQLSLTFRPIMFFVTCNSSGKQDKWSVIKVTDQISLQAL